jgi:hypothetical protein
MTFTSARLRVETLKALKALRVWGAEHDDTVDDVIQRLIRFYLAKPTDSKKSTKRTEKHD